MPDDLTPEPSARPAAAFTQAVSSRRMQTFAAAVVAAAVLLALLAVARTFLIPLAVALFLFSLLSAGIDRIEAVRLGPLHTPRWAASVAALAALAAGLFALFTLVSAQINTLIAVGPFYIERTEAALADLAVDFGEEAADGLVTAFRDLRAGDQMRALAGSAGGTLVTATLVTIYVGFLLAERPRMQRKLARLTPDPVQAARLDGILRAITRSVHRYILVKTLVSALTGALTYAVLTAAGVDLAKTIALVTFMLNYIPNIGSIMATALAALVVFVQFDDAGLILGVILALSGIQFTLGNVIEPLLLGRTLMLSPFVVVMSLVFWGLVWGVAGMFLAVPIMVTVLIVCAHVPGLRPLAILMSESGELPGEG